MLSEPSNFTDSSEKDECRAHNINALRGSRLWNPATRALHCDWLELAGRNAPTSLILSDARMLGPARFIGVDTDKSVVESLRAQHRPNCEFHHGDLCKLLQERRSLFSRVGVLNLDTTCGWQGDRRPPIVEMCAGAAAFIVSRLTSANVGEVPAQEFLFIVNGYVRRSAEVIPTIDRALAPLRAAVQALRMPIRVARAMTYPSRGRTSEMVNLAVAIGY